jgi:hypothetical protein
VKRIKKDLILQMIKELVELQANAPTDYVQQRLKPILLGFLNNKLDFDKAIKYITINMEQSNSIINKIFWFNVIKVIKNYFNQVKRLK